MIILLTGATGFIGTQLALGLRRAGHVVITTRRHPPPGSQELQADFARDHDPHLWLPRLRGINAVLNAVGLIRESAGQTFDAVHTRAPQALFAACVQAGVQRVVQISALGADAGTTAYFTSKRRADEFLASLALDWTIVQPALVYGSRGVSAGLFTMLAGLPLIPLPGRGTQRVQPIHIDDLVEAIVNLFGREPLPRQYVPLATVLDIILGVAILVVSRRRWLWLTQMVLIVVYTSIITFRLPEFWLHPYGPILKNLPLLASLYLLYVIDRPHRPWNT